MNRLESSSVHSMMTRIITGVVLAAIGIPCLLFGGWYYMAAMILMSIFSIYEFVSAPNKGRFNIFIFLVVYFMTLFFIYSRYFMDQTMRESVVNNQTFIVNSIAISPYAIIIYLILLFSITLFSKRFTVVDACYLFSMGLYIGFAFLAMMLVRYLPNTQAYYGKEGLASCVLASYIVIASGMNDIGAYFIGSIFGKHKMAPTISPHKTWEGFFGGFVISFASSFLFAWLIEHFAQTSSGQAVALLPGVLEFANGHVGWLVMLSLMIPIIGDIGDLLFSAIKRYYAIKDYGTLLPGHGGILDRIDSLSLVVMFVALVIAAITKGWAFLI